MDLKEQKQDCTLVDHHQLDILYHLNSVYIKIVPFFVFTQALHDFRTSTILVYIIILNGKGCLTHLRISVVSLNGKINDLKNY